MDEASEHINILVVDDSQENVRLLSHVLKEEGYKIREANTGKEALQIVEKNLPDIILLDVMMPGMNGFEVCKKLKQGEATQDIPIIFLSAVTDTDSKVTGFEVGGVDYITKPFQREEVLARIDLHVRLKQLQHELEQKIEALEEREHRLNALNQRKDWLMRILSHDIRNPVTGIIGVAELLFNTSDSFNTTDKQDMYRSILQSGREIRNLVVDLLSKEYAEKGISELSISEVDLKSLIHDVIDLHRPTAMVKDIQFDLKEVRSLNLMVDPLKMDQVLGNLVSNALKFTPEGGTVSVGVDVDTDENTAIITVSDTGTGISDSEMKKLFTRDHSEVVQPGTRGEEGTGIGLDIVNRFTKLHGGKLNVKSTKGEGTLFTVKIPITH